MDGRKLTMATQACGDAWHEIVLRHQAAALEAGYIRFPDLAGRARSESAEFALQSTPTTAHELNLRRVQATTMRQSWGVELTHLTYRHA